MKYYRRKFANLKVSISHERAVTNMVNYILKGVKGGARFKREFEISFGTNGRTCVGGFYSNCRKAYPRIKIANWALNEEATVFTEYKALAKRARIGTVYSLDSQNVTDAILAHEIAHAVHQTCQKSTWMNLKPEWDKGCGKPHGKNWQEIYGILRDKFVNPHLTVEDAVAIMAEQDKKAAQLEKDWGDVTDPVDREDISLTARAFEYMNRGRKVPEWINKRFDKIAELREQNQRS